jgi:hypothetical protein
MRQLHMARAHGAQHGVGLRQRRRDAADDHLDAFMKASSSGLGGASAVAFRVLGVRFHAKERYKHPLALAAERCRQGAAP